jgi:hypothetical protein
MSDHSGEIERALHSLAAQAHGFVRDRSGARPLSRPGLITTLYFRHGHSAEIRERLVGCFSLFFEEHRSLLGWQDYKQQQPLSARLFARTRQQVLNSRADAALCWSLSGAPAQALSTCRLFVHCPRESQAGSDLSCLHMALPITLLTNAVALRLYQRWMEYFASQVRAEHGYSGLACLFPCAPGDHLNMEFRQALKFPGLLVDPQPHIDSLRVFKAIKGANWYTFLGTSFVRKLNGNDAIRAELARHREIFCSSYEHGLIVRAGTVPELGSVDAPPPAYCAVNKLIKAVRLQETGSLHPCSFPGQGFCPISTAQWYARLDERPAPMLVTGQQCNRSGYWFSTAMAGSRQRIDAGQVMPGFAHRPAERTQWFWDGDLD